MTRTVTRRNLLRIGGGTAATLGLSAMAGELAAVSALAQAGVEVFGVERPASSLEEVFLEVTGGETV